jgi:hypothetical protein
MEMTPVECELSMRGCDGIATTNVQDDGEVIACCHACQVAWDWRHRTEGADNSGDAYAQVLDRITDKLDGK